MTRWILVGAILGAGIVATVLGGWDGLVVYLVLAVIVAAVAYGAASGGDWLRTASRGRFHDHH